MNSTAMPSCMPESLATCRPFRINMSVWVVHIKLWRDLDQDRDNDLDLDRIILSRDSNV